MTYEEKLEQLTEAINNSTLETIIPYWNECCYDMNMADDAIYSNDEYGIEEMYGEAKPFDVLSGALYGHYNINDKYVCFNGYANLDSFTYLTEEHCPVDVDVLAKWLVDNDNEDAFTDFEVDFDED